MPPAASLPTPGVLDHDWQPKSGAMYQAPHVDDFTKTRSASLERREGRFDKSTAGALYVTQKFANPSGRSNADGIRGPGVLNT